jgi:hypothetical protein
MKGVIVQIGEPKSIVLFNNGKIAAITTPADCHVGTVVTVKFNNKLKITLLVLAAVFLIGLGIFIGASFLGGRPEEPPPASVIEDEETYGWQRGQKKRQEIEKRFSE